jgi:hypothetical protein
VLADNLPYNADITPCVPRTHPFAHHFRVIFSQESAETGLYRLSLRRNRIITGCFGVPDNPSKKKGVGHHTNPEALAPSPLRKGTKPHDSTG